MERKNVNSYFSHDSNARNDDKLIRLRMRHGAEGYGVYFMILERLSGEADYVSVKDYNVIAFDFRVDASLVKAVIEDFGLFTFTEDGKGFYSESFMRRMEMKDSINKKRKEAAAARWGNRKNNSPTDNRTVEKSQNVPKEKQDKSRQPRTATSDVSPVVSPIPSAPPIEKEVPLGPPQPSAPVPLAESVVEMKRPNTQWSESVCMRYNIPVDQLPGYVDDFALQCSKETHPSIQDAKSHFCRWLAKQPNKSKNQSSAPAPNDYKFNGGFGGKDV